LEYSEANRLLEANKLNVKNANIFFIVLLYNFNFRFLDLAKV